MAKLDTEWANADIDAFLHVTAQVSPNTSGPAPSPKVSTLRFATPECTCRRKIPEVRSSWPWSSSPHSACWHVGLIKPLETV